jgi:hypothetical protein
MLRYKESVALPLLVAGILLANDPHDALAADHDAVVANLLHARTDLHGFLKRRCSAKGLRLMLAEPEKINRCR